MIMKPIAGQHPSKHGSHGGEPRLRFHHAVLSIFFLVLLGRVPPSIADTVQYVYDPAGRLVAVVTPNGSTTTYQYDPAGNIILIATNAADTVAVSTFSPGSGVSGATVTVVGSGFDTTPGNNAVTFNASAATVTAATANTLVVSIPDGASTGKIAVTNSAGSATSAFAFVVLPAGSDLPTITSFAPALGSVDSSVVVTGTNFQIPVADNKIAFSGRPAVTTQGSTTSLSTSVPTGATSGKVSVLTRYGKTLSDSDFFVVPSPYSNTDIGVTGRLIVDGDGQAIGLDVNKKALILFDAGAGQYLRLRLVGTAFTPTTGCAGRFSILNQSNTALLAPMTVNAGDVNIDLPITRTADTYTLLINLSAGCAFSSTLAINTMTASSIVWADGYPMPNPVTEGGNLALKVNVTGNLPLGMVTFKEYATVLGTAPLSQVDSSSTSTAAFGISTLASGYHTITASYAGDANNLSPDTLSQVIAVNMTSRANTTIAWRSQIVNVIGQTILLGTVIVGDTRVKNGTVSFSEKSLPVGIPNPVPYHCLDGCAGATVYLSNLAAGTHNITAKYSGDPYNSPSESQFALVVSDKTASSILWAYASPGAEPTVVGMPLYLQVKIDGTAITGTVILKDGGLPLETPIPVKPAFCDPVSMGGPGNLPTQCHLASAVIGPVSLSPGIHSISVFYSGDASNLPSSISAQITVKDKTASTMSWIVAPYPNPVVEGQDLHLNVKLEGTRPSGNITFKDGSAVLGPPRQVGYDGVCQCFNAAFSISTLLPGTHKITAEYSGDESNLPSSVSAQVTVTPK